MQEKTEKKKYNLLLPTKIHDLLEAEAQREYTSISKIVLGLIIKHLKEEGKLTEQEAGEEAEEE